MYVKRLLFSLLVAFVATAASATTITVTTLADSGSGSLRDAITQANNCNHCVIAFSVAGEIALTSPLPSITNGDVTIDGYTAPGASPNTNAFGLPDNAVIVIGINGQGIVGTGFDIVGNNDTLRGLAIYGFTAGGNGQGIVATSAGSAVIIGNYIGTDRSGNSAVPNDRGIVLGGVGAHATIGTSAPADRNLISGNNAEGLLTQGGAVVGRMVGNYIGVSASLGALGNNIGISLLSHNQRIGDSSGGNLISGNRSFGLFTTFGTHVITRNIIGTNGSNSAIPNAAGIYGSGANGLSGSTIDSNTISGNSGFGIRIEQTSGVSIVNNRIGVGSDGTTALPNGGPGVIIAGGSNINVGGTGNGNTIAYNGGNGVTVTSGTHNTIRGNAIFSNGGGIDLGGDGATANDANDSDTGANNLQNWPSVDSTTLYTTRLEVVTSINSAGAPGTAALLIDVYKADASVSPEGMRYLGSSGCIAGNTLNGYTFNLPPTGIAGGDGIVLTATSYSDTGCTAVNDGTSEFSGGLSVSFCIPPAVTITASASRICAGTSVSLDAGSGFASYQWSTGDTTRTIAVAPSSTSNYSVTVTNGLGCSATANTTITVDSPPSPVISPAAPAPFCSGGSVTLNASGIGSFQWMLNGQPINSATGPSYVASAAGSYTVVATNGVCIVTSSPVTVTVNSFPDATVTAPGFVCANGGGTASVPSTSGATYNWTVTNGAITGGQGTNSITFTAAASGSVSISAGVTKNSCPSNGSASVPIDSFSPVITPGGPTSFCAGGNVVLSATAGAVSYQWLLDGSPVNSANGSSFTASNSGAYSVTAVNSNGCSVTSPAVSVTSKPLPVSNITAPSSVCANTSSSASVPAQAGAQYAWTITNGAITGGQGTNSIVFSAGPSGSVSFGVTVTNNGCSTSGSAQTAVGVFVPSISASGPTTFCSGGSVTLMASAASSYQWLKSGLPINGSNGQTLVVNIAGSYSVSAVDGICSGTSSPVNVTVNSFPDATVSAPGFVCANGGGTGSVPSTSGATYNWTVTNGAITSGQGTNSIAFTAAASGSVSISAAVTTNSCTSNGSANVPIDSFSPVVTPGGPTSFCAGGNVVLSATAGAVSYQWLLDGSPINSANGSSFTASSSGAYSVIAVNSNGCAVTSPAINVTSKPLPVANLTAPSSVCANSSGSASVPAQSGAQYAWTITNGVITGGQGTNSIAFTAAASGSVSISAGVTANSCTSNGSANVPIDSFSPVVTAGGPTSFCAGGSVVLSATAGSVSYQWLVNGSPINSANGSSFTASTSGAYSVTAVNSNGCSVTSPAVSVTSKPLPVSNITAPSSVCANTSSSASVPAQGGAQYAWTITNGAITGGQGTNSIVFSAGSSGSVSFGVTVTNNGCSTSGSAQTAVGVFVPSINASGPTTFCSGGSVTLTASAASSYQWLKSGQPISGSNGQTLFINIAGSYSVSAVNGVCSGTSSPVNVVINANPAIAISGPSSPVCPNAPTVLDATNGFASYHWSTGATTRSITVTPSATTSYSVTGIDANGCSAAANATVVVAPVADPTITAPLVVNAAQTANTASVAVGPAGTSYVWTVKNGTVASGNGTPSITWDASTVSPISIIVVETTGACSVTGQANVGVAGQADLGVAINAPGFVAPGAPFTITITANNGGPSDAANAVVHLALPAGFVLSSVASDAWVCTATGSAATCRVTTAAVGGLGSITIHAAAPAAISAYDIEADISSATTDTHAANDSAIAHINVGQVTAGACSTTAPAILVPFDGANGVASHLDIVWSPTPNATSYSLYVGSGNAAPSLVATTSSTSATVALPAGANTAYVLASFSSDCPPLLSARNTFRVALDSTCNTAAPVLVSPVPGTTPSSPVEFAWNPVSGASVYRLWIAPDGGPAQDVSVTGSTSVSIPLPNGDYRFFVEALFPGCNSKLSESNRFSIAKDPCADRALPVPVSPFDGSTTAGSKIDFRWARTPNASGYRVWLSIDGTPFASLGTTQSLTFPAYIGRGVVQWYVEALFDGCASTESIHWKFTVPSSDSCGSVLPTLLAPANGVSASSRDVDFQWSAVPGAVAYELWIALADSSATLMGTTESTSLRRSMQGGTFDWFVRAIVAGCLPRDSATNRFTYTLPAGCSAQRPLLTLPVDDARTIIAPVNFQWSKVPGATQYEVWVSSNHLPATLLGTTADVHLDAQAVPVGAAEWYVVALLGSCPPLASTPNTFTVVAGPNCGSFDIPSLRAPSEVSSDIRYHIRWSSIGSAQLYEVEEATDRDFGGADIFMTRIPEMEFVHSNPGGVAVPYFYRVRSVSVCTGARSLFSPVASVTVLPLTVSASREIHAATPADDRQILHNHLLLGGPGGGAGISATGDTFRVTTNVPWLSVTPSSGTLPAGGVLLDLTMDPADLPFGISSGDLFITTGSATATSQSIGRVRPLGDQPPTATPVSVNVSQPVNTAAKNTPAPDSLIFAAVAHAAGGAQSFLSDVRLTNTSPQVMKYQLTFTPTGESGINLSKSTSINVEPGRTGALNDVLATWFGVTPLSPSASGALEVRPLTTTTTSTSGAPRGGVPNVITFAASRLYSVGSAGSFGQYVQPTAYVNFITKSIGDATAASALTLQQTAQNATRHTNLGLIEASGDPATVLLSVFNDSGQKLKEFTQTLKGGQNLQLNSVLIAQGLSFNDGRIEARVTGGNGKITTYASVVEDANGDSTLIAPVSIRSLGATRYVVPGVAQISSDFANWRTDVRVFNGGDAPVTTTMTYFPQEGEPKSQQVTIAAKEVKTYDSALQSLFGLTSGGGALHIITTSTSSLVATARTYNQTPAGSFGQFIPAATFGDSAGRDSRSLQLIELEESSRFRTNLGLAEMTGNPVQVELTIVPADGKLAATAVVDLPANGFRQYSSIIKSAGFNSTYDVRVSAKVIGGTGRITAYASVIDLSTGDPTFIPAQ